MDIHTTSHPLPPPSLPAAASNTTNAKIANAKTTELRVHFRTRHCPTDVALQKIGSVLGVLCDSDVRVRVRVSSERTREHS